MDIVERIDDLLTVDGLKRNWAFLAISSIFIMAVYLRYMPEKGMQYLQALDPYMIFRMSQHLAAEGSLPALDFMRYFPYPTPVYRLQLGNIIFPAVIYWMGPFLFFPSYLEWAQFFPALMGGFSVVMMYFLGKELWNREAGIAAAFFLATVSGVMHRTGAGFFEKEPLGTFFMMVSLYGFTRAWRRDSWNWGIVSGITLAFFTISWGGSKMSWLLYPLVTGTVMMLDQDIERLVKAYTPTIIIGGAVASALNPSRFWFTTHFFLANLGLLGFLWSRHLVEELEIIEESYLKLYVPVMSVLGIIGLAISPLLWDWPYSAIIKPVLNALTQRSTAVIAGTVAENAPASLGQLVTQLGALSAARLNPALGVFSHLLGSWPLAFIGVALLGTRILLMLAKKTSGREFDRSEYYMAFGGVYLGWLIAFSYFFQSSIFLAVIPASLAAIGGLIFAAMSWKGEVNVEFRWYYFLPFFWIVTNILGAVAKSRLIFLAAFPVALSAGYTVSVATRGLKEIDYRDMFDQISGDQVRWTVLIAFVGLVVGVNTASGYVSAQSISGSPNQLWMENLEHMREETPEGSVILSWWDYGYWFESIGRRPAVADGGNMGYYTSSGKINFPLADFLTSSSPENQTDFLRKHSVDYIVLDETMIGKYSAVSQIHHRSNSEFKSMIQVSSSNLRQARSNGNTTVATFQNARTGLKVYVPFSTENFEVNQPPTLETRRGRIRIGCVLTDSGRKNFDNVTREASYCLAENPFYSIERGLRGGQAKMVLVPKEISDSMLVRLYLMDGHGIDYVKKVPGGSNGYVRMWEVDIK